MSAPTIQAGHYTLRRCGHCEPTSCVEPAMLGWLTASECHACQVADAAADARVPANDLEQLAQRIAILVDPVLRAFAWRSLECMADAEALGVRDRGSVEYAALREQAHRFIDLAIGASKRTTHDLFLVGDAFEAIADADAARISLRLAELGRAQG